MIPGTERNFSCVHKVQGLVEQLTFKNIFESQLIYALKLQHLI